MGAPARQSRGSTFLQYSASLLPWFPSRPLERSDRQSVCDSILGNPEIMSRTNRVGGRITLPPPTPPSKRVRTSSLSGLGNAIVSDKLNNRATGASETHGYPLRSD